MRGYRIRNDSKTAISLKPTPTWVTVLPSWKPKVHYTACQQHPWRASLKRLGWSKPLPCLSAAFCFFQSAGPFRFLLAARLVWDWHSVILLFKGKGLVNLVSFWNFLKLFWVVHHLVKKLPWWLECCPKIRIAGLTRETWGFLCVWPSRAGIIKMRCHVQCFFGLLLLLFLTWIWGVKLRFSGSGDKHFTDSYFSSTNWLFWEWVLTE